MEWSLDHVFSIVVEMRKCERKFYGYFIKTIVHLEISNGISRIFYKLSRSKLKEFSYVTGKANSNNIKIMMALILV